MYTSNYKEAVTISISKTIGDDCEIYTSRVKSNSAECVLEYIIFTKEVDKFILPKEDKNGRIIKKIKHINPPEKREKITYALSPDATNGESREVELEYTECIEGLVYPHIFIFGDNVVEVEKNAFENTKFNTVVWPQSVCIVPESCFFNAKVSRIKFEGDIKEIRYGAFKLAGYDDDPLGVDIPDSCESIGDYCFFGSRLSCVTWPVSCHRIPDWCFASSTINSIKGLEDVRELGDSAFFCIIAKELDFNSSYLERIGCSCFQNATVKKFIPPYYYPQEIKQDAFKDTII